MTARDVYRLQAVAAAAARAAADGRSAARALETASAAQHAQRELGGIVYRVPAANTEDLQAKIDRIARRARRANAAPIRLRDSGERDRSPVGREHAYLVLSAMAPTVPGWTLVARLRHHPHAPTDVSPIPHPGQPVDLDAWRLAVADCDHCRLVRRRRDTYLLADSSGRIVQVGTGCLTDFTGGHDAGPAIRAARLLTDCHDALHIDDEDGPLPADAAEYLAHVARLARGGRFRSAAAATVDQPATWRLALEAIASPTPPALSNDDQRKAARVLAWARALDSDDDYHQRLATALHSDHLSRRELPLAASAVPAYERARRADRARALRAGHLAEPGAHVTVEAEVIAARRTSAGAWAHTLRSGDGHQLTVYARRRVPDGTRARINAVVRDHVTYHGLPTTVIRPTHRLDAHLLP